MRTVRAIPLDHRLAQLVAKGVCLGDAQHRLNALVKELATPRLDYFELCRRFQRLGGLLTRKDFCRRARRYLEAQPDATPKQMARDLFRGAERAEIHRQFDPSRWYRRRIQAFRNHQALLKESA